MGLVGTAGSVRSLGAPCVSASWLEPISAQLRTDGFFDQIVASTCVRLQHWTLNSCY